MRCKKCGHENARPLMEPVRPPITPGITEDATKPIDIYVRWACEKCLRYHFRDGTLYENPFK